jgi:heavy metal sensor kinase
MKSIRLTLIVFFLVLLVLALGAVSAVVYQTTHQSLMAKEATARERLQERFDRSSAEVKKKFDDALLHRAEQVANVAQAPPSRNRYQSLYVLGVLSAVVSPQGQVQVPIWWAEVPVPGRQWDEHRLATHVRRLGNTRSINIEPDLSGSVSFLSLLGDWWLLRYPESIKIVYDENVLPGNEGQDGEYCWISSATGEIWQSSHSLDGFVVPRTEQPSAQEKPAFSDQQLDGKVIRVVTLRANPRFAYWRLLTARRNSSQPGSARGRGEPQRSRGEPPRPRGGPVGDWSLPNPQPLVFFIQYARATDRRDAELARYQAEFNKDIANQKAETQASLDSLRKHLLWISLATFAAIVVGGFWLIRLGLSPLHRLSEAVSRVTEKDFRLQLGNAKMPSELRPIVERLSQTFSLLERAFAREKQAAADISHELRTPLAALLTTTEVALRKPRSPEEYRELLGDCRESGKQMSQLVERLLALARLDAGADTLRPRELDVAGLAEQCAALVRPLAEARGLRLQVHQEGPANVLADADKLREVLTNLLHNAIQYNRPDGSIDLVVEQNNGDLRVEVRDTGIGIPAAAREHIFERFYRADPSRQADGLHAGLGLAIVKGYIDLMGGTIGVDSTEGQGTTFRIRLPVPSVPATGIKIDRTFAGSKV